MSKILKIGYTTILHAARINAGLSMNEYTVCDLIYGLSNNPKANYTGWSNAAQTTIGKMIGVSRNSAGVILRKMVEDGYLETRKDGKKKLYRTTAKWYDEILCYDGPDLTRKLSHYDKKVVTSPDKKVVTDNNIYNNNTDNISADEKSAPSLQHKCRLFFEGYYKQQKGVDYYYDVKSAANLKKLLKKIESVILENGKDNDEDLILSSFKKLVTGITDSWIRDNLSIPIINSKFNEIVAANIQKKKQTGPDRRKSHADFLNLS